MVFRTIMVVYYVHIIWISWIRNRRWCTRVVVTQRMVLYMETTCLLICTSYSDLVQTSQKLLLVLTLQSRLEKWLTCINDLHSLQINKQKSMVISYESCTDVTKIFHMNFPSTMPKCIFSCCEIIFIFLFPMCTISIDSGVARIFQQWGPKRGNGRRVWVGVSAPPPPPR